MNKEQAVSTLQHVIGAITYVPISTILANIPSIQDSRVKARVQVFSSDDMHEILQSIQAVKDWIESSRAV